MRVGISRCFGCGQRTPAAQSAADEATIVAPEAIVDEAAGPPGREPATRPGGPLEKLARDLNEIQKKILAATGGKMVKQVLVQGRKQDRPGEVKSGAERFYGDDAVAAVAGLVPAGLLVPVGDDRFRLTANGARIALALVRRGAW